MAKLTKKSNLDPDKTRTPNKTDIRIVDLSGIKLARIEVQAG